MLREDYYIMKSKTKQIISITSLCLVMALIVLVIVLAISHTYKGATFYNVNGTFAEDDRPDIITVRTNYDKELQFRKDSETDQKMYNQLWLAYEDAGSYSQLNSIFIGISSKQPYAERLDKSSQSMSSLFDAQDEYCLIFEWYDARTMMNSDGTTFTYTVGNATYDAPKYSRAYLSVTADDVITKTPVYLLEADRNYKSGTTRYVYNGYFNTSSLYQTLAKLEYQRV